MPPPLRALLSGKVELVTLSVPLEFWTPPKEALLLERVLWSTLSVPPLLRTPPPNNPLVAPALPSATVRHARVSFAPRSTKNARTEWSPVAAYGDGCLLAVDVEPHGVGDGR